MDYYYHDQSNPYGTGEHPPPHQFNHPPLGVPSGWSQSYEPSQPQDSTRPIPGYAYSLSVVGRQDPSLSMLRPDYPYENDTGIKHEDTPEPMPVSGGIIRTGMAPTPRLYDPAATMHPHISVEQHDDNGESVGDASHDDNSGRDGDVSGQESPVPENDANGETPSPGGEGHSDVAEEEDNHHQSHHDRHHHHEETSDPAPRTPPNPGEDRNVDIPTSDAVTVVEAEEQVNPAGWGHEGDDSDDSDDSDYRFVEEVTSPTTSYVSSGSDRPPAGNTAAPQGSDHESESSSDSDSGSGSDSGSDSGSNRGSEEGEDADQEPPYRTIRLRDLTAFARESAAELEGRSIIVIAGDCHLSRLSSASITTSPEDAAAVILVAGDLYTYPSGSSPPSSSTRQKRKRDDSRGERRVRRRLEFS
ncbi:hypothetical protein F5X96DRAFT_631261 [Biscogniauxia mediterranea]|nr:hypothetical protein F5X96DRAFT_631261 [Biscogniauxia mediterranea]